MDGNYIGPIGTKVETSEGETGYFCGYATIVEPSGPAATACWTLPVIRVEVMDHGAWRDEYRLYDTEYLEIVKDKED
jgi:hypothetical protein